MNMGYEDDELKPYLEPEPDYRDHKRIGESASMYITLTTYRVYVQQRTRYECSYIAQDYAREIIVFPFFEST